MTLARHIPIAAVVVLSLAGAAAAQTLYKLIDKDGKVTYSEKPPKDFAGKVVPLEIDPNRNTATLPKPVKTEEAPAAGKPKAKPRKVEGQKGVDSEERVQEARDKLDAARKALDDARDNPGPDDITRIGSAKGGGSRPVLSEGYARRLGALEAQVKQAEENLKQAEENR